MWPTDSSGLPQAYDYGNSIVSFPGTASILASIRSLLFFSALSQPSGKKMPPERVWPPSHQRAFGKMFLEVYFFFFCSCKNSSNYPSAVISNLTMRRAPSGFTSCLVLERNQTHKAVPSSLHLAAIPHARSALHFLKQILHTLHM